MKHNPRGNSRLAGSAQSWTKPPSHWILAERKPLHFWLLSYFTSTERPLERLDSGQVGLPPTHSMCDKCVKAPGSPEGSLGKSRDRWILWLQKPPRVMHNIRKGLQTDMERIYSQRYSGRGQGKRDRNLPVSHQKDPFPNFDPGEKLPKQSAKMFGKPMKCTKINYTECGLLPL